MTHPIRLALALLALPAVLAALAAAAPHAHAQMPQPPEIAARQYILVDLASDQVLAERGADQQADPASLTKLMTAHLVFNAIRDRKLDLEQTLPVSRRAWDERKGGASVMFIDPTMQPKVSELLRGLIVQSGNDAAVALAEGVSGSVENFVAAMNRQAQAWGLKNTQFRNVTGMSESGHHSSARDVAAVAARVIREHPQFYPLYAIRQYTYNNIRQDNRNLLLGRDPSVDGMKTGYTESAGYCLVASSARATPGGQRRLLSVVLGTDSREARASESQKLLNWGWTAWDAVRLFEPGRTIVSAPVWKGEAREVSLVAETPGGGLWVSVPKGEGDKLRTAVERTEPLLAPLVAGQRVGTIKVTTAGGAAVATVPLVAQQAVPLAGFFGRTWDAVRLWIR
ncbi:MAG: D-alanyl-D-alanine carboxypeptidase family protein [Pseudomonadota bacterium]|jgi:D-alanyl-D-alanine carboxypeptidase (penicillin-binding protein 5/6)|nr:D-alanyl-D-alanine carboxypeptidase [Rubrivivax sp.]MCA3257416.1 D-alanyl-D-alanine carboxypeptidase [Rubrivivax sp.]MCE2910916.1 D-alanyl-D-alanine carboxypeptidase [Rubrivivax sp.]MCZ8031906.1 D-alanyl-D-alanine carboxypeptidase [Rubrivivax sp.]